jgi:hypothetical protein
MLNYLRIDSAGLPEVHRGFLKLFCKLKRYRNYIQAILTDAYAFLDNAAGGFQSDQKVVEVEVDMPGSPQEIEYNSGKGTYYKTFFVNLR